jgi:hypothetical protein
MEGTLPRIDPASATLDDLAAAREQRPYAASDRGVEVLRYAEGLALLRDRRLRRAARSVTASTRSASPTGRCARHGTGCS